jgi:transmembrane sensor
MSVTKLAYLFNSYFEKTATQEETQELLQLLALSADDEQLTMLLRNAWENLQTENPFFSSIKSEEMVQYILNPQATDNVVHLKPVSKTGVWYKYAAVAAVLLLVGASLYFVLHSNRGLPKQAKVANDVAPGGNKAVLTLANGSTIVLDSAHNGVLAKQGNSIINKTGDGKLVYRASATADNEVPQINTVTTPRGGQYHIVLPDGSDVWLNAASSISYPTIFNGKTRRVEITGEAYFEVTKNAAMPFIVKSPRAEVDVLGTHFNIMAYADEDVMKTTLLEGAVKIIANGSSGILKPGQQAVLNNKDELSINNDADDEIAWKNGLFQFRGADIRSIMRQAARWYNVDVVFEGKVPVKQYTGRISRNVKASALLNMLKYTGVNAIIEGNSIYIKN